jgi:uncharacterized protein YuzE
VHRLDCNDIIIISVHLDQEEAKSFETQEVTPGIMLDFDGDGRVIGIEVLDVSKRMMRSRAAA